MSQGAQRVVSVEVMAMAGGVRGGLGPCRDAATAPMAGRRQADSLLGRWRVRPRSQRFMTRPGQRAAGAAPGAQDHARSPAQDSAPASADHAPEPAEPAPAPRREPAATPAPWSRRPGRRTRWAIWLAAALVTAAVAIGVALKVTPLQTVTVAGQVIKVGTTAPSLSFSGPGEIDLFGQSLPTHIQFLGPVRPRLQLTQITINSELTNFVQGAGPAGAERILGDRLASGWIDYFAWEIGLTAVGSLILLGALAGWRRLPHRTTLKLLAGGLVLTEVINLGAIMLTAYTAPSTLRQVRSLSQLVGSERTVTDARKGVPVPPGVRLVVIGDSTAAGAGLPCGPQRVPGRPGLRAEHRLLRRGPGPLQRLAGDEPGLQQRHDRPGPARPGRARRRDRARPDRRAAAGHARVRGHRQRGRGRPGLVGHAAPVRGRQDLQRQGHDRLLPAAAAFVQQELPPAAGPARRAAQPSRRSSSTATTTRSTCS